MTNPQVETRFGMPNLSHFFLLDRKYVRPSGKAKAFPGCLRNGCRSQIPYPHCSREAAQHAGEGGAMDGIHEGEWRAAISWDNLNGKNACCKLQQTTQGNRSQRCGRRRCFSVVKNMDGPSFSSAWRFAAWCPASRVGPWILQAIARPVSRAVVRSALSPP